MLSNINVIALVSILSISFGCSGDTDPIGTDTDDSSSGSGESGSNETGTSSAESSMTFFLTSEGPGNGGNLGGLDGADAHCNALAQAAGVSQRDWRAYLSTTGSDGIDAIDRIGTGPWENSEGVVVATDINNLLSENNNLTKETVLTETGEIVNGRGDNPNRHDILTGTELDGRSSSNSFDSTCENWTSDGAGSALVGHHDRVGGGANPTSWSTAHSSAGCSQTDLEGTGGDGLFYCFAF